MAQKQPQQPVFDRESLLHSKTFSHVQQDFLKAVLYKEMYTMEEAKKEISEFYGKEG